LELARRIVHRLCTVLRESAGSSYPDACVDGNIAATADLTLAPVQAPGLTPWDAGAALANQLRAGSALHDVAQAGTLVILLNEQVGTSPAELLDTLRFAWEKTNIVRLRFARSAASQPGLPFIE